MRRMVWIFSALALMPVGLVAPMTSAHDDPPVSPGQWRLDTVFPVGGTPSTRALRAAEPGTHVNGWWWLPITPLSKVISDHNRELQQAAAMPRQPLPRVHQFWGLSGGAMIPPVENDTSGNATGTLIPDTPAPSESGKVGTILIETTNYVVAVGAQGSAYGARALKNYAANFIGKPIRWVIVPDASESSWTGALEYHTAGQPLIVITSQAFTDVMAARAAVAPDDPASSAGTRRWRVAGGYPGQPASTRIPRNTDWRLNGIPAEWSDPPCPQAAGSEIICQAVPGHGEPMTLDGLEFRFTNVINDVAGLVTYVPANRLLIAPTMIDGNLANTAPLQGPVVSIRQVLAANDLMRNNFTAADGARYFVSLRVPFLGPLPDGRLRGLLFLDAMAAALTSVHNQVLEEIRRDKALDDIVAGVTLPADVRAQCNQFWPFSPCDELVNSLGSVVKGVHHEYLGWFDGTARDLATHVTAKERTQLFVDAAGGTDELLAVARKVAAVDGSLASIERALYLVEPLHELAPSPQVDLLYFQLLWKAGMLQTASDARNYYLTLAWEHRPQEQ